MQGQPQLYNTLSRAVEPLRSREPGKIGLYVCGMTVYDDCHIGHARAMIAFDIVTRHLRHRGYEVTLVRNHTDVDDKIIQRAARDGRNALDVSAQYIHKLEEDLSALGLAPPTVTPKVSDHIPEVIELITSLIAREHAYQAANGDVYFSVESFPGYGKLSGKRLEDLRAGERIAVDPNKRHPGDFALWKASDHAATLIGADPAWESPWGPGRPGWHIECSAMSRRYLGDTFDIHGGGIDLVFPHHENEIAQSECGTGHAPMARYWMHNGHLTMVDTSGEVKMSKSLGNIIRIRDIVNQVPSEALRLAYLDTHYRSPLPWSSERLVNSLSALDRLYQAKETALEVLQTGVDAPLSDCGEAGEEAYRLATDFSERFNTAMDDDFNSASAVGALFDLVRAVNRFGNDKKRRGRGSRVMRPVLSAFSLCGEVLGLGRMDPTAFFDELKQKRLAAEGVDPAEIDGLVAARASARASKDWAEADRLRNVLNERRIVVMDGAQGSTWRVKVD